MFTKVFIVCSICSYTLAKDGLTTSGTLFVVSLPLYYDRGEVYGLIGHLSMFTEEEFVVVKIIEPTEIDNPDARGFNTNTYEMFKNKKQTHVIPEDLNIPRVGLFPSVVIKSTGPIRVIMWAATPLYLVMDSFTLLPKRSCYRSYYVVTAKGHPFFSVHSFDNPSTSLIVDFPDTLLRDTFNVWCDASSNCTEGRTITVTLVQYQVWHFTLAGKTRDLHNTVIRSDQPVYVISGNIVCQIEYSSVDVCLTSVKPTQTWGKEYVVPNDIHSENMFRINTATFPLTIYVYTKEKSFITKIILSSNDLTYNYGKTENPLGITADVPFALYQMFVSRALNSSKGHDSSILNLIPVEQWLQGVVYNDIGDLGQFVKEHYLLALSVNTAPPVVDAKANISWTAFLTVRNKTYHIGMANPASLNIGVDVDSKSGPLIIYVKVYHPNGSGIYSMATLFYDSHFGSIYSPHCYKSELFYPSDGIDNDCDGFIDEEFKNNIDDDGDGQVDEDYVEPYQDGEWSKWYRSCDMDCGNEILAVTIRYCEGKSKFGKDCKGDVILCNNSACPGECQGDSKDCYCGGGCSNCTKSVFLCDSCKAGYLSSKHCTAPCPKGWTGIGCTQAVAKIAAVIMEENNGKTMTGIIIIMFGVLLLTMVFCSMCLFFLLNRTSVSQQDEE